LLTRQADIATLLWQTATRLPESDRVAIQVRLPRQGRTVTGKDDNVC